MGTQSTIPASPLPPDRVSPKIASLSLPTKPCVLPNSRSLFLVFPSDNAQLNCEQPSQQQCLELCSSPTPLAHGYGGAAFTGQLPCSLLSRTFTSSWATLFQPWRKKHAANSQHHKHQDNIFWGIPRLMYSLLTCMPAGNYLIQSCEHVACFQSTEHDMCVTTLIMTSSCQHTPSWVKLHETSKVPKVIQSSLTTAL